MEPEPDWVTSEVFDYQPPAGTRDRAVDNKRVYAMHFARVYPLYVQKAERKNRTGDEVDRVLCWLTGYSLEQLREHAQGETSLEEFVSNAPAIAERMTLVSGVVCGVRVETLEDPVMRKIRCMDKLVDELAKGRALEKIVNR